MYVIVRTDKTGKQTFKLTPKRADADAFWSELVIRSSDASRGSDCSCELMMFEADDVETEGHARMAMFDNSYTKIKGVTIRGIPSLKHKVGRGGPKAVTEDLLAKADAEVKQRAEDYLSWLENDLDELEGYLAKAKQGADPATTLRGLELCSYRIKGQGGMFGYTLVTAIAAKMFNYLDHLETELDSRDLEVVRVQADALRVIAIQGLSGDGGEAGKVLMGELEEMTNKVLSKKGDVQPRSARNLGAPKA